MAQRFPRTEFVGIDFHESSINRARENAKGFSNIRFEEARAQDLPGSEYDLVTIFDALPDMGDPVGAARKAPQTLKPDGTLMLVEPMAGEGLSDNLNSVGLVYYAF